MLRAALLIAAGSAVVAIAASGSASTVYPVREVALYCGAVILEVVVLLAVLRPGSYRNSWGRALAGAGLCALALWGSAQNSGAPDYVFMHQRWLAAAGAALAILAVSGLIAARGK